MFELSIYASSSNISPNNARNPVVGHDIKYEYSREIYICLATQRHNLKMKTISFKENYVKTPVITCCALCMVNKLLGAISVVKLIYTKYYFKQKYMYMFRIFDALCAQEERWVNIVKQQNHGYNFVDISRGVKWMAKVWVLCVTLCWLIMAKYSMIVRVHI